MSRYSYKFSFLLFTRVSLPFTPLQLVPFLFCLSSHLSSVFPLSHLSRSTTRIPPSTFESTFVSVSRVVRQQREKKVPNAFGHFRLIPWSADRTGMHLEVIVTPANRALLLLPLTWHHHRRFRLLVHSGSFYFFHSSFLGRFYQNFDYFFLHVLSKLIPNLHILFFLPNVSFSPPLKYTFLNSVSTVLLSSVWTAFFCLCLEMQCVFEFWENFASF